MIIEVLPVSPFVQNATILACEQTREAIIIDPGDEAPRILERLQQLNLTAKFIIATHAHIDHVGAVAEIQQALKIPFYLHREELFWLEQLPHQARMFGFPACTVPQVDKHIQEGESIHWGKCQGKIIHTPGHSPGGICILLENEIVVGDTLFAGSIGRTDLPGGSHQTLIASIQQKLWPLADHLRVYCGHGPTTTIGQEKRHNPFVGQAAY